MREIPLSKGYVAFVDDCDFERVSAYKWKALVNFRADGSSRVYARSYGEQYLHRLIMNAPVRVEVDHIDGNSLDNRRANLRLCSRTENSYNKRPQTGGSSAYKGVSWSKRDRKWRAQVQVNRKHIHLGYFLSELDAFKAYDVAAKELFGEFARVNICHAQED